MRWKRFTVGAVAAGALVGGLRVGARLLGPVDSSHQSTKSCGGLVWRTTTVTRTSRFEPTPVVVREESVVEREGRAIATDVADFRCVLRGHTLQTSAAIVQRLEGQRADVHIIEGSGAQQHDVHFEHDVESTSWSHEGDWFAAIGPYGQISVARASDPTTKPVVLSRDKHLVGARVVWSPDSKTACFVIGKRPAGEDGSAELWCAEVPAAPVTVARAAWAGSGTTAPWITFDGTKPHLCGDDLKPRDAQCIMARRAE